MSELVERLKSKHEYCIGPKCENRELMKEAASVIEQLQARVDGLTAALERLGDNDIVVASPDELDGGHFSRECLQRNLFERIEYAQTALKGVSDE